MPSSLFRTATCAGALAGLLLIAAPTATHAQTTIPVTNCNDRGAGSLRAAVASAASGNIIAMTGLSCGRIELTSGPIAIPQDALTLRGPGHSALVLDGNNLGSVLRHSGSGTLRIERLAIERGKHIARNAEGGCIYSAGNLDIRDSHVRHCVARCQGGTSSYAYGAGVYAAGTMYVSGSRIHSNIANGNETAGGGIFSRGRLTIVRSSVINNTAGRDGGLYSDGGLATNYVSIIRNVARSSGGGIAAQGKVSIANTTIANNRADRLAGGIDVWGSSAKRIANSTISGNRGTYCYSAVLMSGPGSKIVNSTIAFNVLLANRCPNPDRSAMGAIRSIGSLHLQSTIIANNIMNWAGDVYDVGGNPRADTLTGTNNLIPRSRLGLPPGTLTFDPALAPLADNGGFGQTHALVEGSPAVDRGNNIAGLAYDQRGAGHPRVLGPQADIGAFEGTVPPSTIAVTNCNDAGTGSLRDAVARASTRGTIDMRALTCRTITLTSGAIEIPQDDLILKGPGYDRLTISGNNASRIFSHFGRGTINAGTLQIHDLTVAYGQALDLHSATGGCINSRGSVEVTNSQIHHCMAEGTYPGASAQGGGIFTGQYGRVTLTTSAVFANAVHAPHYASGGGIVSSGLTLDRSVLCDNVADGSSSSEAGGASVSDSTPPGNGGLTMDQSLVCRNTAGNAAAINVYGGPVSITHSTISKNRGLNGVGAVVVTSTLTPSFPTVISNSTFSGNTSARYASALYLVRDGEQSLSNSTIAFNHEQTLSDGRCYGAVSVVGLAHLQSNIIGNNTCADGNADLGGRPQWGDAVDGADNLIMASSLATPPDTLTSDPQLGPLANNGGRTRTHALLNGSPAIDTGNNADGLLYDQRGPGFPRVKGPRADIGAYER